MSLAPEQFALIPLSVAAGLDLYLTLFLIGIGTLTGLWQGPLPGALSDLAAAPVIAVVGALYVLEVAAERSPGAGLLWNAFHATIRPLSGALLALLVLDGHSGASLAGGALLAAVLTSVIHGARSGAAFLRWVGPRSEPSAGLVSLAEDTIVLGLVTLAIDAPPWGALVVGLGLVWVARPTPSWLRAFWYAIRGGIAGLVQSEAGGKWLRASDLPDWVRGAEEHDSEDRVDELTRAAAAAAHRLPGVPRFVTGWLVVDESGVRFLTRWGPTVRSVDITGLGATRGLEQEPFRRVDFADDEERMFLILGPDGPGIQSVVAAFPAGRR